MIRRVVKDPDIDDGRTKFMRAGCCNLNQQGEGKGQQGCEEKREFAKQVRIITRHV